MGGVFNSMGIDAGVILIVLLVLEIFLFVLAILKLFQVFLRPKLH